MHTFFHGWRRKVGVATLVMACALATAWIRSLFLAEAVICRSDKKTVQDVRSIPGGLIWSAIHEGESKFVADNAYYRLTGANVFVSPFESNRLWSCDLIAIEFGETKSPMPDMFIKVWVIRYWAILVPLTLLSAYLILAPTRKQPPTASQPNA